MGFWKGNKLVADKTTTYFKNYTVVCNTSEDELIKEVQIDEFNFTLQDKMHLYVRFVNGHTVTSTKDNMVVVSDYPSIKIKYLNLSSGTYEYTDEIPITMGGEFVGENFVKKNETLDLIYWEDLNVFDCVNGDVIWNNHFQFKTKSGITKIPKQMIGADYLNLDNITLSTHVNSASEGNPNKYLAGSWNDGVNHVVSTDGSTSFENDIFKINYSLRLRLDVWNSGYWYATVSGKHVVKLTPKLVNGIYYYDYLLDIKHNNVSFYIDSNTNYNISDSSSCKTKTVNIHVDSDKPTEGITVEIPFEGSQITRLDQGLRVIELKEQTITTLLSNFYYA